MQYNQKSPAELQCHEPQYLPDYFVLSDHVAIRITMASN